MSTGSPTPQGWKRYFSPTFRMLLLAWAILVVVIYAITQLTGLSTTAHKPTPAPSVPMWQPQEDARAPLPVKTIPPAPTPSEAPLPSPPVTQVAPARPSPEDVAATKMRWLGVKTKIDDLQERLDPALEDTKAWTTLLKQLPSDEAGKRIAGSKPHIDKYRSLMQETRPPARLAEQYRDTLKVHQETVTKYLADPENTTGPRPELDQDLERLREDVKALASKYREARLALEGLVSETAAMPAADTTLEKAVQQREREVASQYLDQLTATRNAAEAEAQRILREAEEKAIKEKAKAEAESVARLGAQEARRIREATEDRLATLTEEAARRKREEEANRLRTIAEDPQVQRKYSALLQKGYMQFKCSPGGGMMSKGDRPLPASFGDLNSRGWLKNAETFARAMSRQPNPDFNVFNDRPTNAYPATAADWEEMEKLLEQFKMLAPIWMEMKLLEP